MWWYLRSYFREQRIRVFLTISGLSLSLASVLLAYGIAAWVDTNSSKALVYAINGGSLWITPQDGLRFERRVGAIVASGKLPGSIIDAVKSTDRDAGIKRIAVGEAEINHKLVVCYATDENSGTSLLASTEIWDSLGRTPVQITVAGRQTSVIGVDPNLPGAAVSGAFDVWAPVIHTDSAPSWILVRTEHPRLVANALAAKLGAQVTDSPEQLSTGSGESGIAVFLLSSSLSRFDPFSFRTKFSSMVVNAAMSTIFGWVARYIFLIGFVLAVTSILIGVREKRREIGLFAALGLQSGVTLLFLLESAVVSGAAYIAGFVVAAIGLAEILPGQLWIKVIGPSLVMGLIYGFSLAFMIPLIAAQQVASKHATNLVREGVAP